MLTGWAALAAAAVSFACTFFLRALPFLFLGRNKQIPSFIQYLGKALPAAIMAVLVIYCLRNIGIDDNGMKQVAAVLFTACIHIWKKNTYLSIITGTAFYMILIALAWLVSSNCGING